MINSKDSEEKIKEDIRKRYKTFIKKEDCYKELEQLIKMSIILKDIPKDMVDLKVDEFIILIDALIYDKEQQNLNVFNSSPNSSEERRKENNLFTEQDLDYQDIEFEKQNTIEDNLLIKDFIRNNSESFMKEDSYNKEEQEAEDYFMMNNTEYARGEEDINEDYLNFDNFLLNTKENGRGEDLYTNEDLNFKDFIMNNKEYANEDYSKEENNKLKDIKDLQDSLRKFLIYEEKRKFNGKSKFNGKLLLLLIFLFPFFFSDFIYKQKPY